MRKLTASSPNTGEKRDGRRSDLLPVPDVSHWGLLVLRIRVLVRHDESATVSVHRVARVLARPSDLFCLDERGDGMTEPDEALLYARRSGVPVYQHQTVADAFRAGSAASAERIKELEAEVRELKEALVAVVMEATARDVPITTDTIRFSAPIRSMLKEPLND